jgi:hypothetical protein
VVWSRVGCPKNISARFWFSRAGIHTGGFVFLAIARHGIVFPLVTPVFSFFIRQERVARFGVQQERALAACVSF